MRCVRFLFVAWLCVAAACTRAERAAGAGAVVVDDFGDSVRLAAPARRVVSLNPVMTEFLLAIGARDRLVGRTHWDLGPAADVPDVGDGMQPNVEAILAQRPDLVLLYQSESNRPAARRLRAAGVMTLTLRTDRVADLARVAPIVGAAVGLDSAAHAASDSVAATIAAVVASTTPTQRPTLFWHIWDAPVITIGAGSYLDELVEAAGGRSIFHDLPAASPQVALEEIVRRDPMYVLAGPAGAERIRTSAAWQAVRAVREGRILVVDTALVGKPGVRMGEAAVHLRALLAAGVSTR
ncbi:MAG: ABC transporter substrate-binding protein [Gemmatimonadetes bacterium]|nr:ABC transporter substrate-binding protein [Gemmatimonadota bacterium]